MRNALISNFPITQQQSIQTAPVTSEHGKNPISKQADNWQQWASSASIQLSPVYMKAVTTYLQKGVVGTQRLQLAPKTSPSPPWLQMPGTSSSCFTYYWVTNRELELPQATLNWVNLCVWPTELTELEFKIRAFTLAGSRTAPQDANCRVIKSRPRYSVLDKLKHVFIRT